MIWQKIGSQNSHWILRYAQNDEHLSSFLSQNNTPEEQNGV